MVFKHTADHCASFSVVTRWRQNYRRYVQGRMGDLVPSGFALGWRCCAAFHPWCDFQAEGTVSAVGCVWLETRDPSRPRSLWAKGDLLVRDGRAQPQRGQAAGAGGKTGSWHRSPSVRILSPFPLLFYW